MHRREFLAVAGAAGTTATAGCASLVSPVPLGYEVRADTRVARETVWRFDLDRGDGVYLKVNNVRGVTTLVIVLRPGGNQLAGERVGTEKEWTIQAEETGQWAVSVTPADIADVVIGLER